MIHTNESHTFLLFRGYGISMRVDHKSSKESIFVTDPSENQLTNTANYHSYKHLSGVVQYL